MKKLLGFYSLIILLGLILPARANPNPGSDASAQETSYPNTSQGLESLIQEILQTIKSKNNTQADVLIQGLLVPEDSSWFVNVYGPAFGASFASTYKRMRPAIEKEIRAVYTGNVKHDWLAPKVLKFDDPEKVNSPIDRFLNCMNSVVPLYATAFHEGSTAMRFSLKAGESVKQESGDLDGYFVYDREAFRFVPMSIFMKLPPERPMRIKLDLNAMRSKITDEVGVSFPAEALKKGISGRVVVRLVIDVAGKIKEAKALEGDPLLSAPVLDALKRWQFTPTLLDGDPVEVEVDVPYTFESFRR